MKTTVFAVVAAAFLQTASFLTQTMSFTCTRNSPTQFLMQLCVYHNEDDVQYFVAVDPNTGDVNVTCDITMTSGVNGSSCVLSTINMTDVASSDNRCGAQAITGGWEFEFWSRLNIYVTVFNESRNYHLLCTSSDLSPGTVQTDADVTFTGVINNFTADNPQPRLFFVADDNQNGVYEEILPSNMPIPIGKLVKLRIELIMNEFTEGQTLYGLYPRNCLASTANFVNNAPVSAARTDVLTDNKGCVNPNVVFPPLGGEFRQSLLQTNPHKFETTTALAWPMRVLFYEPGPTTIIIYIQCEVVFCGGPAGDDPRCNNSCAHVARKKRDTETDMENDGDAKNPKTVSTYVYVTVPDIVNVGPVNDEAKDETPVAPTEDLTEKKIALGVVSVSVAMLLAIVVTLAVCVYLAYRRKDEEKEEKEQKKPKKDKN